ncbi:MAG: Sir2 family NAD-dependent protein deacetylase [Thermomicrobiales bacterium]
MSQSPQHSPLSSEEMWPDLLAPEISSADMDRLEDVVAPARRIVAFTGAGISTESGIPDYRGPNGVWARNAIPSVDTLRTDPDAQREHWRFRRANYPVMLARQPNDGHRALVDLERAGRLLAVITQNIDGLHQKAGDHPERVIELHGSTHRLRCMTCGTEYDGLAIQKRLDAGEEDPRCEVCGGPLRSATILFGEPLPEAALRKAVAVSQVCDLMLVVGSSLVVNPAARLPAIAKQHGARLVIINRTPTPLDDIADVHLVAEAGPTLRDLVRRLGVPGMATSGDPSATGL